MTPSEKPRVQGSGRTLFTRRNFLGIASMTAAWLALEQRALLRAADFSSTIELGVCQSFSQHQLIKSSGFQYIEDSVTGALMPKSPESDFNKRCDEIKSASLPVRACTGFLPGDMKVVGPAVDLDALLRHAETVCRRANRVGVTRIVFGSGEARRIPAGFDPARAREQFIGFCKKAAPMGQANNVIFVLEALNRGETNFINRVDEGLAIVDAVGHSHFQMHADIFHMRRENEGPESIIKAGARLKHCHVAEVKTRSAPGVEGDDFRPYFKALKAIGYQGGISIECSWKNLPAELPTAHRVLREQLQVI